MSFVKQMMHKDGGMVRLITATERGKPCWFLLELDAEHYSDYKAKMKRGDLNIADYGAIKQSGWGEPPEEIRRAYA